MLTRAASLQWVILKLYFQCCIVFTFLGMAQSSIIWNLLTQSFMCTHKKNWRLIILRLLTSQFGCCTMLRCVGFSNIKTLHTLLNFIKQQSRLTFSDMILLVLTISNLIFALNQGHLKIWTEDLKPFFLSWKPVGIWKNGTNIIWRSLKNT